MSMNPHRYAHEKVGAAISWLMLPDVEFERRLLGAMAELEVAFHSTPPAPSAAGHVGRIKRIIGAEQWREHARRLTPSERSELVNTFWDLDRAISRDYYTFDARL